MNTDLNLDHLLTFYIEATYAPEKRKDLYSALALLMSNGYSYFDTQLIQYLANNDMYDTNDLHDIVFNKIYFKMVEVIEQHHISVVADPQTTTLSQLNDIANFVLIFPYLENYDMISYRLFSESDPYDIFIDLLGMFSINPKESFYDVIEHVDQTLIDSMRQLVSDKLNDDDYVINKSHSEIFQYFMAFTADYNTLGQRLFEEGFTASDLTTIMKLSSVSIPEYIKEKSLNGSKVEVALEILSILLLATDTYELPNLHFSKQWDLFLDDAQDVGMLTRIMQNILVDFNDYVEQRRKGFEEVDQ